jgi:hypothetical protein
MTVKALTTAEQKKLKILLQKQKEWDLKKVHGQRASVKKLQINKG